MESETTSDNSSDYSDVDSDVSSCSTQPEVSYETVEMTCGDVFEWNRMRLEGRESEFLACYKKTKAKTPAEVSYVAISPNSPDVFVQIPVLSIRKSRVGLMIGIILVISQISYTLYETLQDDHSVWRQKFYRIMVVLSTLVGVSWLLTSHTFFSTAKVVLALSCASSLFYGFCSVSFFVLAKMESESDYCIN